MPSRSENMRLGLPIAAVLLVIDQLSKWVIVSQVMQPPRVIEVTGFFNIVMAWNTGVSFGMFASDSPYGRWALVALALAISAGMAVWLLRAETRLQAAALGLVIGGALGNVIDRLRFGAVADFLDFHAGGYHWPAFNAADSAIAVGVALLLYDALFVGRRSPIK
ncbi:MAG: signal peptidase II [Alphaproteobacteria bacterium]|nr:signal peptidase II [Alphaproteobacteria bacterium]